MAASSSSVFDRLPDEVVEYIFTLISDSPPVETSNHVHNSSSGLTYFSYVTHEPYLRRTFKNLLSLERVCRRFHNILRSPTFWRRKCHRDNVVVVNEPLAISQGIDFRRVYFSNPFHPDYNVLDFDVRHEGGENNFWDRRIRTEQIPVGSDILYNAFKQIVPCVATSFQWATYNREKIPLLRKEQKKFSHLRTMIEFSVCIAGRWDCAYEYQLELHFSDGHRWQRRGGYTNGDNNWHRITYRYGRYPKDRKPPKVSIRMRGKDQSSWAGEFGAKFAQTKLRLVLRGENEEDIEEIEETLKEPEIIDPDEYYATHN